MMIDPHSRHDEFRIGGAGIAGLTCAICLARAGYRVKLFERASQVGERHKGDFEYLENWSTLEDVLDELQRIGLRVNFWLQPLKRVTVFGPRWQFRFDAKSSTPLAYTTARGAFEEAIDFGLAQQAREAGVQIITNCSVGAGDVDIVAIGGGVPSAIASGYVFETDLPDHVMMVIDDHLAPKGYAYLIVNRGHGCLIVAMTEGYKRVNEYLRRALAEFQQIIPIEPRRMQRVSYVAACNMRASSAVSRDGKLYLGEAAGFQDALMGFGMRYAMLSGYLAARSIIERKSYDDLWQARFGNLLKSAAVNRLFFQTFGCNRLYRPLLKWISYRSDDTLSVLRWWYYPSRWKLFSYALLKPLMERAGTRVWGQHFARTSLWRDTSSTPQ